MHSVEVTEQEIQVALDLSARREFSASLAKFQEMLPRAGDLRARMTILFGIVTCSTWLKLEQIRENAIRELKQLPDYEVSNAFVIMATARAYSDTGRANEALDLINANLRSEVLKRDDFRDLKYEHLFLKGHALVQLARYDEALVELHGAHATCPEGNFETDLLIEQSNCYLALAQYDEAFDTASQAMSRGDEDMATLAMQHMAEARMWQSRVPEALDLYLALQKRLPCKLVQEERIQAGIKNAIAYLEKLHPQGNPF